ncbi:MULTISPECIES: hypothetical protein [unclassified Pantoea]|uniref:hypothetical protein n=1 Tax=unclassified Pantoea TaxID=2630326 RepID=UPI001CD675DD|nr:MULTISPECIES: hypothetical protein [unclassified Pantoea]MCA1176787.1 hypothetical protein [Pantoea sp. alder69]MCA1251239.1 hypothetical protein [Pantoea sp. alder70]MCA1265612.1 hypothetical protein [Pantoea sp. alder81]
MQIGRAVHGADALLFGRAFAGPQVGHRFKSQQPHTFGAVGEENYAINGTGRDSQAPMPRTLCSSGEPLLGLKLVIALSCSNLIPCVQLVRGIYTMNGKNRDFPASSAPQKIAPDSVTTLLTRASLRFILPDNRLVVENPIANAR